jgi:superfamily II DNA or RNA helicase
MDSAAFFDRINSWNEFLAAVAPLSDTDKGTAFERLVAHYLRIDPIYRTKLAHVWLLADVPPELHARLRLRSRDMGIDVIAETHTGEFWAIQAKFRADADATIPFGELATFSSLAFHVCAGAFTYALVCTTTARITDTLAGLPDLGELTTETWSELGPDFFFSLRDSFAATAPPAPPASRTPQAHQLSAVAAALTHYRDRNEPRGKLISPCGSGKSLTAYWIARDLGARRVLIAVPSLALVRQTLETWMREALADDRAVDWLCVCSDAEVTRVDTSETVAHVHELGIPCDTVPAALAAHLTTLAATPGLQVVLTTYQSSPVLAAAARTAGFAFDFAVLDEAHKTTGKAAGVFAHLLDDAHLPLPRRLFMTATERRFAGTSDDIVSMDDPALYGETFSLLTFKAAIAAEPAILCDYRILTIGVRQSEVDRLLADNRYLSLKIKGDEDVETFALTLASLVALQRATTEHGVRHTVSFHSSIPRAKQFRELCERLNSAFTSEQPTAAFHVNGKMGSAARQREIKQFLAAAPSLITNARCLTEGVDVPRIDCVFFADPKGSTIEIVQAAGRALRLAPGKTRGYILLPLVVPDGATLDEVTATSAFKFVLFVLRALAAHDERIIEWFRATAEGRTPEVGGLVDFDFAHVVAPLGVNAAEFASQIEVRCWEGVAKLALRPYPEAAKFVRSLGVKSFTEYWRAVKELKTKGQWPADVPAGPAAAYGALGWKDWGEYLGTGTAAYQRGFRESRRIWRPFPEARAWAHQLKFRSSADWYRFRNREFPDIGFLPEDIPYSPEVSYKGKGWISWDDFLGIDWMPFDQARAFACSLKLTGQRQWKQYAKGERPDLPPKPEDIPASPWYAYENRGWAGWRNWLGTEKPVREKTAATTPTKPRAPRNPRPSRFRDFASARAFARSLQLESSTGWQAYIEGKRPDKVPRPADIPRTPRNAYREQWQGWGDWLGTGNVAPFRKIFRPFAEARAFARALGLRTGDDWQKWSVIPGNRPSDIPSRPESTYAKHGWISWPDFLQPPVSTETT